MKLLSVKFKSSAESELFQKFMFSVGFCWNSGEMVVKNTHCEYIGLWYDGRLTYSSTTDISSNVDEISYSEFMDNQKIKLDYNNLIVGNKLVFFNKYKKEVCVDYIPIKNGVYFEYNGYNKNSYGITYFELIDLSNGDTLSVNEFNMHNFMLFRDYRKLKISKITDNCR